MIKAQQILPIVDSFGRVHDSLRVSVTDRCNIRCFYCMPEIVRFLPHRQILTFEEIHRLVQITAGMGVRKIRLTGGEPLVRAQLWKLVEMLVSVDGIEDVALTTNGLLLAEQAQQLKDAGLNRLNVSLDSINPRVFEKITRRQGLDKVLAGIEAAQDAGFEKIRLNAVSIIGISESEIVPLAAYARQHDLELRFIEFMPLDADQAWNSEQVLTGSNALRILEDRFGALEPTARTDPQQPAVDYRFVDGKGVVGFINSVSEPFCQLCNRMRVTAEGMFRNCLFSTQEWDLRELLRSGADERQIQDRIRECVHAKKTGHGIDSEDFVRPQKAMYQIGG
jgi:cyclic pyranopterin phosphate synthase